MKKEYRHGQIADVEVTHDGVTRTLKGWAATLRIPYVTVRMRYKRGKRTFSELFRSSDEGVRVVVQENPNTQQVVVTHQSWSFLDDMFSPQVADMVREVARQTGMTPLQVVLKIVEKKTTELLSMKDQS